MRAAALVWQSRLAQPGRAAARGRARRRRLDPHPQHDRRRAARLPRSDGSRRRDRGESGAGSRRLAAQPGPVARLQPRPACWPPCSRWVSACSSGSSSRRRRPIRYVAVLTDQNAQPSMLVTFDPKNGQLVMQRVGDVALQGDKSLELWALPPGAAPRSLGVMDNQPGVRLRASTADVQAAGAGHHAGAARRRAQGRRADRARPVQGSAGRKDDLTPCSVAAVARRAAMRCGFSAA